MKAKKVQIEAFLSQPEIAFAGYSRSSKKFGHQVYEILKQKGYKLYPVNPSGGVNENGEYIFKNLDELPAEVKSLYIITPPEKTDELVNEALTKGYSHIWIQQMSANTHTRKMLENHPGAITGECILMYAQPTGIHKFHNWLADIFGRLPK